MNTSIPLLVTFIAYTGIIYIIAIISARSNKKLDDYLLAGRSLSGPVTALGAGASDMSSWLLMALPGAVYLYGLSMIWLPIALLIGAYLNWKLMAKPLRIQTEQLNALTIPEYLVKRFNDKGWSIRIVTSLVILIFFTFYAAAGFVSGAILLSTIFNSLSYISALFITAGVIVGYTAIGGFLAVNWIDFFQGTLMFLALLIVPGVTYFYIPDFSVAAFLPQDLNVWHNTSVLGILSLFAWGLGYFGQLHINTRFMAIRSTKELPLARRICISWMSFALIGAIATGMLGMIYFNKSLQGNPDTVFIQLASKLFNPWLTGILLSAIVSAIMSTVSAQILMSASILAEDFYHQLFKKVANKKNILVSQLAIVFVALLALIIAASPRQSIFQAVGFAWSGLGAAFGPVLLFSLFWKKTSKIGALAGIIVGALTVIFAKLFIVHPDIVAGFEMLPGFLFASIAIVVGSVLFNCKKPI